MKRTILAALAALALVLAVAACGNHTSGSAQSIEQKQQAQDSKALDLSQPLPHFNYSQLRQNLIELETAQANGVQTTSFFFNQGVRDPVQSCPSIGAPIASTTQLSNPQKIVDDPWYNNSDILSQEDPTGVYSGDSTGTYVMCVGADGKAYADYWEGFVQTVFGPAQWNYATHSVALVGPPSFKFTK